MFVIVIDDDTWVNVTNLKAVLDLHNPEIVMYGGNLPKGWPFLLGGAGYVLSHGALVQLRAGINQCMDNVSPKGIWCDWHSDWIMAKSVLTYCKTTPISLQTEGFVFEQDSDKPWPHPCQENYVTYHRVISVETMRSLDSHYVDGGVS